MVSDIELAAGAARQMGMGVIDSNRWSKFIRLQYPDQFAAILKNKLAAREFPAKKWVTAFIYKTEYYDAIRDFRVLVNLFKVDGKNTGYGKLRTQLRAHRYPEEKIRFYRDKALDLESEDQYQVTQQLKRMPQKNISTLEQIIWTIDGEFYGYFAFKGDGSNKRNNWGVSKLNENATELVSYGISKEEAITLAQKLTEADAKKLNKTTKQIIGQLKEGYFPIDPALEEHGQKQFAQIALIPVPNSSNYAIQYTTIERVSYITRPLGKVEAEKLFQGARSIQEIDRIIRTFRYHER